MLYRLPLVLAVIPHALALWPIPRTLKTGTDFLVLSPQFTIAVNVADPPQDLLDAVSETKGFLNNDKLQVRARGLCQSVENSLVQASRGWTRLLRCRRGEDRQSVAQSDADAAEHPPGPPYFGRGCEGYRQPLGRVHPLYPQRRKACRVVCKLDSWAFPWLDDFCAILVRSRRRNLHECRPGEHTQRYSGICKSPLGLCRRIFSVTPQPYRGFMLDTSRNLQVP